MLCLFYKLSKDLMGLNILENMHIDLGANKMLLKAMMAFVLANIKMGTGTISLSPLHFS